MDKAKEKQQNKLEALLGYLLNSDSDNRKHLYLTTCIAARAEGTYYEVADEERDLLRIRMLKQKDKKFWQILEEDMANTFTEIPNIFIEAKKKFGLAT